MVVKSYCSCKKQMTILQCTHVALVKRAFQLGIDKPPKTILKLACFQPIPIGFATVLPKIRKNERNVGVRRAKSTEKHKGDAATHTKYRLDAQNEAQKSD